MGRTANDNPVRAQQRRDKEYNQRALALGKALRQPAQGRAGARGAVASQRARHVRKARTTRSVPMIWKNRTSQCLLHARTATMHPRRKSAGPTHKDAQNCAALSVGRGSGPRVGIASGPGSGASGSSEGCGSEAGSARELSERERLGHALWRHARGFASGTLEEKAALVPVHLGRPRDLGPGVVATRHVVHHLLVAGHGGCGVRGQRRPGPGEPSQHAALMVQMLLVFWSGRAKSASRSQNCKTAPAAAMTRSKLWIKKP
jgi:hypothetical protein